MVSTSIQVVSFRKVYGHKDKTVDHDVFRVVYGVRSLYPSGNTLM